MCNRHIADGILEQRTKLAAGAEQGMASRDILNGVSQVIVALTIKSKSMFRLLMFAAKTFWKTPLRSARGGEENRGVLC